ncbi:hypothetical protein ACRAWF_33315, partial [Streptomyces sp. L7]
MVAPLGIRAGLLGVFPDHWSFAGGSPLQLREPACSPCSSAVRGRGVTHGLPNGIRMSDACTSLDVRVRCAQQQQQQ